MSKIEVLVTTMYQDDFNKFKSMNLQTDAILANQTDRNEYAETRIDGCNVKLISTTTRGTSRNRNIAMAYSNQKTEIFILADDDLIFVDGYEQLVLEEFEKHPEAEAIKFNLHDLSDTRKISMKQIQKFEKATRRNMSSSGVWGVAIKRVALNRFNLKFREDFGPGTENYCGEDTIFLMNMIDKGVKFYRSPVDIAGIDQSESSWFQGHNERYFTTVGMVIGTVYPLISYLLVIRSAIRAYKRNDSNLSFGTILSSYYKGIKRRKKQ